MSRSRSRVAGFALLAALLAVAGLAVPVGAADAVRSEVDARKVGVQDQVTLTITVEGPGVSTQMSWVNGQASQSRSWTYALQPIAVGHAEVGPVRVRFGAGEQVAPAIPIDVVAGSVAPAQPPPSNDPFARDPFADLLGRRRPAAEPKLFVEAMASRSSVFVGEPILLTYYVYTQANLSGLQFADAPQYTGFWVEDLPAPQPPRAEQVAVDGVPYTRF
ncbi:MAG: protein BatD, partial [Candidatus Eisenbacteria bacterium]